MSKPVIKHGDVLSNEDHAVVGYAVGWGDACRPAHGEAVIIVPVDRHGLTADNPNPDMSAMRAFGEAQADAFWSEAIKVVNGCGGKPMASQPTMTDTDSHT